MRIAVIGSTGFIGREICAQVIARGHALVPVSRAPAVVVGTECAVVRFDDPRDITSVLDGCDAVVHAAGAAHKLVSSTSEALIAFRVGNVELTRAVAEGARATRVSHVVSISSIGVLGATSGRVPFDDWSVAAPHDHYSRSKLDAEQVLDVVLSGTSVRFVSVRPPLVYGRGAPGNFGRLVSWLRRGYPLPVGACCARRAVMSVRNLGDLVMYLVESGRVTPTTLVCRDAEQPTVAEFVLAIAHQLNRTSQVWSLPESLMSLACAAMGRLADWRRLTQPLEVDMSRGLEQLRWRAPRALRAELEWAVPA